MKSIAYIIPYFGKLPKSFDFWLLGCRANPTVDFFVFTDDKSNHNYPDNVLINYITFQEFVDKVQKNFNFNICLSKPYKICDFRPAFGEIFSKELSGYDFWGYCDLDMIFGNIRKFYTDDVLDKYDRIGCQGHSTVYKNTSEVNARYKIGENSSYNYKEVFTVDRGFAFDELGMDSVYEILNIPYFSDVVFAHLSRFDSSFFLALMPESENYKNENQIFTWKNGVLLRHYIFDNKIIDEEFMYLHYWLRPTRFKISHYTVDNQYLIYPDVTTDDDSTVTKQLILKKGKQSKVLFYLRYAYAHRNKITFRKLLNFFNGFLK